jgi:predicted ATPase/DNA-binding CsgD family transcriptional regulator
VSCGLPVATSSVVGRQDDVASVTERLTAGALVTVTGPPGVGKSRVAEAVALTGQAGVAHRVDLAHLDADDAVAGVVAASLRGEHAAGEPLQALTEWVGSGQVTVVLDNGDRVVAGVAAVAEELRRACPTARVLATSREPLRVAGEHVHEIAPLAVPPADTPSGAQQLAGYDAVALFTARAVATRAGFSLTEDVARAVATIARSAAGLPLALELAAARLEVLAPAELADRMADDPLAVLTSPNPTAPPRHRSLAAALEASHQRLDDPQQALLRRLAVFADGCTLDAAAHVCGDETVPPEKVLDALAGLVGKSLVACDTSGGHARYRLLHPVRCFALARLAEAGETDAVRHAHARWALDVAERAEPEITNGVQQHWLARVTAEHANLVAALDWTTTHGHGELALRLAGVLVAYWHVAGCYREGRFWLEAALEAGQDQPRELCAKALRGLGLLAGPGDDPAATAAAQESLDLARDYGDTQDTLRALATLGALRLWPQPVATLPDLEHAVALARQRDDRWALVEALGLCARAYMWRGKVDHARALFQECLDVSRRTGNQRGVARGLIGLGWAAAPAGDEATAMERLDEGLQAARTARAAYETAEALSFLGEQARHRGDLDTAQGLFDECHTTAQFVGSPVLLARAHAGLGRLAHARGDLVTARDHLDRALTLAGDNGLQFVRVRCLLALATVTAAEGDLDRAAELFDHARHAADNNADIQGAADAVAGLARLAADRGQARQVKALHAQALELRRAIPDLPGIAESLEAVAELAAGDGRWAYAVRLFAAACRLRAGPDPDLPHPPDDEQASPGLARSRAELGPDDFDHVWAQGVGMSWNDAVAYATRGRGRQPPTDRGWEALTPTERHVAILAGQRLTNAEIGQRLFISPRTVGNHLYRIYAKLSVSSRRELDAAIADNRE